MMLQMGGVAVSTFANLAMLFYAANLMTRAKDLSIAPLLRWLAVTACASLAVVSLLSIALLLPNGLIASATMSAGATAASLVLYTRILALARRRTKS